MRDEVERFVASLAIPDDRRAVVLAELLDHVACAREAAVREGRDPDVAERDALGCLESLRRSLESVEPAFRVSRRHALARGVVAGVLVAVVLDQGGPLMTGIVGALIAIAIAAVAAPPRVLELLRAELRAPKIRGRLGRALPIGAAMTYGVTIWVTPFLVWMGMLVTRGLRGNTHVDVPWSSFAVLFAVWGVLAVEGVRARFAEA